MELHYHGGKVCAIKHICHLPYRPSNFCAPVKGKTDTMKYREELSEYLRKGEEPETGLFSEEAPEERAHLRLKRILKFLIKHRAGYHQQVQIVLDDLQKMHWRNVLRSLGFKKMGTILKTKPCEFDGDCLTIYYLNLNNGVTPKWIS